MLTIILIIGSFFNAISSQCQSFAAGQCPGSSDCMCTMGVGCDRFSNRTGFPKLQLGGCGGQCRKVARGECGDSCLKNIGPCGGADGGCLNPCGSPCACCGKSPNGHYFLTSFDGSTCSCGACHKYGDYFSADRQRFGCGSTLAVCRSGKCVKLRVTDYGPSCFVENDAGGPVLDASPAVCRALTGGSSCGWSDHFSVTVAMSSPDCKRPLGPFDVTPEEYEEIMRIGKIMEEKYEASQKSGRHLD